MKKLFFLFLLTPLFLFSNTQLDIFTALKYNKKFSELPQEQKNSISKEYDNIVKLSNIVYSEISRSELFQVKNHLITVRAWEQTILNQYKPSEEELKKLYDENNFKKSKEYKFRTITLKDKARTQSIVKQLEERNPKERRLKLFVYFVDKDSIDETTKNKEGQMDWISEGAMPAKLRDNISKLNINDLFVLTTKDSFEIRYIEDIKKPEKATFEESRELLTALAKQNALKEEVQKILGR